MTEMGIEVAGIDRREPLPVAVLPLRLEELPDAGRVFDTTEDDQQALVLDIEDIAVPGLREALLQMREGDHWRVVIPPSQGFGRTGNNQLRRRDVIYDIRLLQIEPPSRSEEG